MNLRDDLFGYRLMTKDWKTRLPFCKFTWGLRNILKWRSRQLLSRQVHFPVDFLKGSFVWFNMGRDLSWLSRSPGPFAATLRSHRNSRGRLVASLIFPRLTRTLCQRSLTTQSSYTHCAPLTCASNRSHSPSLIYFVSVLISVVLFWSLVTSLYYRNKWFLMFGMSVFCIMAN